MGQGKLSRRKLLGGAAATSAGLGVLHQAIPHQGLHTAVDAAFAQSDAHGGGHETQSGGAVVAHPAHAGAVGMVDPRVNGFDPQVIVRDFDEGRRRERRARVGARGRGEDDRGGAGRQVRRLGLQRARARTDAARARGRAPAHPLHERRPAPAHDPLPRDPHSAQGRRARRRRRQHRAGGVVHLRVRGHAVRAPPLPLPLDAARGAHREGALRGVHRRSRSGAGRRPTSS